MKTKLLMERLDAIERQALETLKEVRAMREEMKASSRPSPKGKGEGHSSTKIRVRIQITAELQLRFHIVKVL